MSNTLRALWMSLKEETPTSTLSLGDQLPDNLFEGTASVEPTGEPASCCAPSNTEPLPTAEPVMDSSELFPLTTMDTLNGFLSTLPGNSDLEERVPRSNQKAKIRQELFDAVALYDVENALQFRALARQPDHPLRQLAIRLTRVKDFEKMIAEACKANIYLGKALTFKQRLEAVPKAGDDIRAEVEQFADNYDTLFRMQNWDPSKVWKAIYRTMTRVEANDGKARCVYLQGPASTGKSSLMLLLSCLYRDAEIGNFGPQGVNSQFWLDNLYGKELYLGDEALATPLNIQTYLLLLEGNKGNKTEIKYGDKVELEAKPVIIACNKDIYADCQAYQDAVLKRVCALRFKQVCPKSLKLRPRKELYKFLLRTLIERHLK